MFHWRDNTYFGRLPDGFVRVLRFSSTPHVMWLHKEGISSPTEYPHVDGDFRTVEVLLDIRIAPGEWASIVASVSKGGESGGRYYTAERFHQTEAEDAAPPAPPDQARDAARLLKEYFEALDLSQDPTAVGSTCRLIRAESAARDYLAAQQQNQGERE